MEAYRCSPFASTGILACANPSCHAASLQPSTPTWTTAPCKDTAAQAAQSALPPQIIAVEGRPAL